MWLSSGSPHGSRELAGKIYPMSAWLNSRLMNDPAIKRELFATKELTVQALKSALRRHGDKHCAIKDVWVGPRLRHEVEDGDGFVAVYWVSVEPDSSEP